jgi:drug/metabolite transporter (DMT)-like permease
VKRELMELHLAVFLFGFAGLFGKIINLPAMAIVFWRVLFASLLLFMIILIKGEGFKVRGKARFFIPILGVLLAIHWSTFFYSIQISTVAIGLITYSTFPIFTALLEPLFLRERFEKVNILLSLLVFLGIVLIVPSFDISNNITQGVIWGTLSGFTFSLLTIINRRYVKEYSSLTLAFYQDGFATLSLFPLVLFTNFLPYGMDLGYVVLLGVVFTGVAHTLFIGSLRRVKANYASIIAALEPLYGIVFAFLLLGEVPALRTVIGGAIIISVCFYVTLKSAKFK